MRKNLLLILSMFVGFGLFAQGYEQNFDGFTSGDYLAEVDTDWTTWSNAPGGAEDPTISDAFAASAPNSVFVSGTNDAVFPCGDLTSGAYEISFDMYVPTDRVGYFNIQQVFGSDRAMSLTFMPGGDVTVSAGGQAPTGVTFAHDTWFTVDVQIDLNTDNAKCFIDGEEIVQWTYSLKEDGTAGTLQLGCVNMYAYDGGNGSTPEYYFDNFAFDAMATVLYSQNFDEFTSGDYLAVVDEDWTTWSNAPGGAEDPMISDAQASSTANSAFVSGTNDAVFPCGDLTSGSYKIAFEMYVPTDRVGYFNIQQVFGSDWAMSLTFMPGGDITVSAGGQAPTGFTFTHDTWFPVEVMVDIDADEASCTVDGVLLTEWQYSLKEDGTAGTNQLGCVNMYAYDGGNGSTPEYYFDNFEFVSLSSALAPPTVDVSVDEMVALITDGLAVTETFDIANVGQQNLSYNVYPTYNVSAASGSATGVVAHCGEYENGVGYTGATTAKSAVLLGASLQEEYIGTEITSVEIYVAQEMTETTMYVWAKGETTVPGPGAILYEEDFTPTIDAWNTIELDTPILLTGDPVYIGLAYFQPADMFSIGVDAGPKVLGVNWRSTGPGWSELSAVIEANYCIRANVSGDPQVAWMNVPVDFGMIAPGDSETVGVFISPDGLPNGQYTGAIVVAANDPETGYTEIDVTLDILIGTDELNTLDAVSVYPNPTNDVVFVKADSQIEQVVVSNYLGQVVDVYTALGNEGQINVSQLDNGVYFLEVTTGLAKHTIKVIKK